MLSLSVLTIGDEICIGQIVNTNASWIADQCTRIGCKISIHSTIGDDIQIIVNELERLLSQSDAVIITGGLGPTHDDVTKDALSKYFNDSLVLHQPTLDYLTSIYAKRGQTVSERNATQAMLPSKATILSNSRGTASGMWFEENGKIVISLPGVPTEMKGLMEEHILSHLSKRADETEGVQLYKTLLTTGITEANLADLIGDPKEFLNGSSLAFLPSYQGVRLRIGVQENNKQNASAELERIEYYIRKRANKFIFGENDQTLASVVAQLLIKKNQTVSVAESCTGGMLGAALTDISGSSAYFEGGVQVYSYSAKHNILNVRPETLTQYGAVSKETVEEMAINVRKKFGTTYGISISGIAGPGGGLPEKPVGTVWIGIADEYKVSAKKFVFGNERSINRERSVGSALEMLYRALLDE
ncbi:MAG: competence/damage-inducible protein A [Ignavibacteriae bacterium]|nr:competence/damage-inducible protein A [Ignavibacteriota bacterium]